VVIAGGSEEVNWIQALGFCAMRALSRKYNDTPAKASRPFDRDRDGFVIAEGAGMVILERADHAAKRNASVKGYVTGYALNSNASDMVAPSPAASASVMAEAVGAAGLRPDDIGYVNTHGTATPIGDPAEMEALRLVFGSGKSPAINSTKSMTGHMIGASGAVEAIFCSMMIEKQFVCPSVNLDNPEPEFAWADLVRETRRGVKLRHALSNSFGFGGSNACIIISSPEIFS
jgi:3-oxoacyl-[acyl-carrier-protein] synthase-1